MSQNVKVVDANVDIFIMDAAQGKRSTFCQYCRCNLAQWLEVHSHLFLRYFLFGWRAGFQFSLKPKTSNLNIHFQNSCELLYFGDNKVKY